MGYLFINRDYHSYTMDILSCQPDFILCLTLLPASEHCASFWFGWHNHAKPILASQPFAVSQSQTLTDRCQIPQTRLAPSKAPQPLVDLVAATSLPARLLGDVCTAVWKFAALQVTQTVLDGLHRVSTEKHGHQGQ